MRAGLYMLPTVAQGAIPLITLKVFSQVLTKTDFGVWGVCAAFAAMASGIANLGLLVGYERNYYEFTDEQGKARLLYSVVAFAFVAQLIGLAVVIVVARTAATRLLNSPDQSHLFVLAYATAAVPSMKAYFLVLLRNENKAREYVHFSVDELVLGAIFSIIAVVGLHLGVAGMFGGPLLASTIVFTVLVTRSVMTLRPAFGRKELADTLRVSLPLAPRVLIGAVGNQLDRLVLGAIGSLEAVGVYTVGQRVATIVFAYMTALQNVYQPSVYRMLFAGGAGAARNIGKFLAPFAYASVAAAFVMVLFAADILRAAASAQYATAASVLILFTISYALMFFGKQPQLTFAKRTWLVSVLSVFSVLMNAGCVYAGARIGGPVGAATGLLIANVLTGAVSFVLAQRFAPIAYPPAQTILVFGSLPVAALFSYGLTASHAHWALQIVVKIGLVAGYVVWGWRAGIFAALWSSLGRASAPPPELQEAV